jgi:hypothetical protein
MEQDDLVDPGRLELAMAAGEGPQMQMAHRTSGEAAELQMHQRAFPTQGDGTPGDVLQHARSNIRTWGDDGHRGLP